jgi:hypothetical protein
VLGLEHEMLEIAIMSVCTRCMHKAYSHTEQGCEITTCKCKAVYTNYLLFSDDEIKGKAIESGFLSNNNSLE